MREEDHPGRHSGALKQSAAAAEERRIAAIYRGYAASARRRRAWSAENPGNAAIRAELVDALLPWVPAGGAILDAGCGTGWLLAALAGRGVDPSRLHGVDLLPERVAAAARRVPAAHVGAGDVRDLPVADGSAALVVLLTVLSSLGSDEDVDRALREAARATAPGGAIAIWEPRRPTPGNRATRRIAPQRIAAALGPPELDRPITVLPPLARRLGRATATAYPLLRRVGPLLTHRLVVARPR